jgi:hypothetical protein
VLPAGVIEAINDEQQEVWVALTKEQISEAPSWAWTRSATSSRASSWVSTTAASS